MLTLVRVQVYIPLLDDIRRHWVLVVINMKQKIWYFLDSLRPTEADIDFARFVVIRYFGRCV